MTTAIGIDIGGTGIKGARVDLTSGELISERVKYPTPEGGHPGDVLDVVEHILSDLGGSPEDHTGVCFPAVVTHGVTRSAANVSADWIDFPAAETFAHTLNRDIHFVNDADAAGVAEAQFGAAVGAPGLTIMLTLGTGIGSAFLLDGTLVPNTELGHLELDGFDSEQRASNAAREREGLDFAAWSLRLTRYLRHVERIFSPDLFIIGGGISTQHEEFFPLIDISTPLKPAALFNNAGIVGAAYLAGNSLLD
ncbi:MAG: ROK family protein [Pontimonas sp.]|nr:ROK family protein [Pontimonas sp.]